MKLFLRRWAPVLSWLLPLLLGALVFLPAIRSSFLLDDYMHTAMAEGTFCAKRGPFDLYDFVNDADRAVMIERGLLPWWSHPQLTIRFFRPLTSALRWFEQRAFGNAVLLFHLHSLLWWSTAVLAARRLFRQSFAPRASFLATLIFALAPCHALPIAWLANREVLVSLVFGIFGLTAYESWREERRGSDFATALVCFALAMLAGEYSICFAGYVFAIELTRRRDQLDARLDARATGLLPFALPAAAYLLVRVVLGYGTRGSAFYSDPLREPLTFLRLAPERFVTLLAESWMTIGTSAWGTTLPQWFLAILVVLAIAWSAKPVLRVFSSLERGAKRTATWMFFGSLVSLAPVLAVVPAPRLLGVSAIGMSITVALLLDHAWFAGDRSSNRRTREWMGAVATLFGFAHLIHGPVVSWVSSDELRQTSIAYAATSSALRERIAETETHFPDTEVVVVRGMAGMFFGPFALDPRGAQPARWRILSHAGHVLALRKDARTLELIAPLGESLFPTGPGNLFRSGEIPFQQGDEVRLAGVTIEVTEVGKNGPSKIRATFERDLGDSPHVWIEEDFSGFREAKVPRVGLGAPFDP